MTNNFFWIKSLLLLMCVFFSLSGCNLFIEIIGSLEPEPIVPSTPEATPDPINNQEIFSIFYYNDPEMTQPLNENPYLKEGTYYLLITTTMTLSVNPVIMIDAEGSENDVDNDETVYRENGSYLYLRTIEIDSVSSGSIRENININGIDPVNESTHAAYIDTVPPEGFFNINDNETTTYNPTVILSINANDTSNKPFFMMISNSMEFDGATWLTFENSYSWTLIAGEGTRAVYMKFRDAAGNESSDLTQSIDLMLMS